MKALLYDQFGGNDKFRIGAVSDPLVGPDSVLVKVVAAGLNPVDYKVREGYLQGLMQAVFPVVPGWDVAGIVVKAGLDTPEFSVGDEVLAYARKDFVHGGTLAELVEVPVRTAAHKPSGLSFEDAAALPLTGLTALQTVRRSGLTAGSTVLVHAAAGGVGSFATQLAVMAGARVIGTAGESNHDYLRELGAEPVTYGDGLVAAAKALVPGGFDVILDYVGGQAIDTVPDLLRPGGSLVSIADGRATQLGGTYAWVRPNGGELAELAAMAASGRLRVTVLCKCVFEPGASVAVATWHLDRLAGAQMRGFGHRGVESRDVARCDRRARGLATGRVGQHHRELLRNHLIERAGGVLNPVRGRSAGREGSGRRALVTPPRHVLHG